MTNYRAEIIHPTPAAQYFLVVYATGIDHARALAYRRIQDKYGAGTFYMVGDVYPE
jgi:hypothetical protein